MLTIKTNRQWRDFTYRYDVPEKVLDSDFDYLDAEETVDGFFQYRGVWYHLDGFMRLSTDAPEGMQGWSGYVSDSFFSGVLIRLSDDGEQYQIATYYS